VCFTTYGNLNPNSNASVKTDRKPYGRFVRLILSIYPSLSLILSLSHTLSLSVSVSLSLSLSGKTMAQDWKSLQTDKKSYSGFITLILSIIVVGYGFTTAILLLNSSTSCLAFIGGSGC
jgi:hypothetical protein